MSIESASLGSAKHLHHAGDQTIGTSPHVHRLDREPHRIDADHRNSSRIQAAHAGAASTGQLTLIAVVPRRSSIRISAPWAGVGNCIGTKAAAGGGVTGRLWLGNAALGRLPTEGVSAARTQRLSRLALMPLAVRHRSH